MTLQDKSTNGSSTEGANFSYYVVGTPAVNGTGQYQVNFTADIVSGQISTNESMTIWFLSNGTATKVATSSGNITGSIANAQATVLFLPFSLMANFGSLFNQSGVTSSSYAVVNQSTVTLGSVSVNETVYSFNSQYLATENTACASSQNLTSLSLGLGKVANSNSTIAVFVSFAYTSGNVTGTLELRITSLAKA